MQKQNYELQKPYKNFAITKFKYYHQTKSQPVVGTVPDPTTGRRVESDPASSLGCVTGQARLGSGCGACRALLQATLTCLKNMLMLYLCT